MTYACLCILIQLSLCFHTIYGQDFALEHNFATPWVVHNHSLGEYRNISEFWEIIDAVKPGDVLPYALTLRERENCFADDSSICEGRKRCKINELPESGWDMLHDPVITNRAPFRCLCDEDMMNIDEIVVVSNGSITGSVTRLIKPSCPQPPPCDKCDKEHTIKCLDLGQGKATCICDPDYMEDRNCEKKKNGCEHPHPAATLSGNEACVVKREDRKATGNTCTPIPQSLHYTCLCYEPYREDKRLSFPNCMDNQTHCKRPLCLGFQPKPSHVIPGPTLILDPNHLIGMPDFDESCNSTECECPDGWLGPHCSEKRGEPVPGSWSPWSTCSPDCVLPNERSRYKRIEELHAGTSRATAIGFRSKFGRCTMNDHDFCVGTYRFWRRCRVITLCNSWTSSRLSSVINTAIGKAMIEHDKGSGITPILILTVLMTCVGSSFLIGYNLAILNLPAEHIKKFLGDTMLGGKKEKGGIDTAFLYAQVSTTFVIAGAMGAFSCGWLADLVGRRNGLLINHLFAILGGVFCAPCVRMGQPALLFVGRFIIGINCGITIGIASLYLTEVAPRRLRGAIGACNQLAITIGICLAYVVTLRSTLNTPTFWPIACGLGAVPAFISLIVLPFCPESPRFLFIKKNNEELARVNFQRLNKIEDVDTFIGELREEIEVTSSLPEFKFTQLFTQKDLRMPVLIACLIQVLQQLSGINAVISYSSTMLAGAGIPDKYSEFCVLAIGVLNVLVTIVSLPLLERAGRRTLLLWPTVALAMSLLCLTITVTLSQTSPKLQQTMGIISTVLILLYICGFALGLGPVPALIVSEIFRQSPRAAAYSLSQSIQWLSNLLVLFSYPSLEAKIKGYSFLPFFVVVVVCWVFFFLFMPETKNRTFDEVARDLAFGHVVVGKRRVSLEDAEMTPVRKGEQNASNTDLAETKPTLSVVELRNVNTPTSTPA